MARKWMRTIDSAQRQVVLNQPISQKTGPLSRVTFDIQGVVLESNGRRETHKFEHMVQHGIAYHNQKPLTPWQRIRRMNSIIGEIIFIEAEVIQVVFWARPPFDLIFDLKNEDCVQDWRECEIMALSGGFHFRGGEHMPGSEVRRKNRSLLIP